MICHPRPEDTGPGFTQYLKPQKVNRQSIPFGKVSKSVSLRLAQIFRKSFEKMCNRVESSPHQKVINNTLIYV
jgi:hypothetical protein